MMSYQETIQGFIALLQGMAADCGGKDKSVWGRILPPKDQLIQLQETTADLLALYAEFEKEAIGVQSHLFPFLDAEKREKWKFLFANDTHP